MDKNAVLLSYDLLPVLEELVKNSNPQSAVELVISIIKYDRDGTEPDFTDMMVAFIWRTMVKPKLDEYKRRYEERAKRNRENGAKGGRPPKNQNETTETQKTQMVLEKPTEPKKPNQTSIDKISIDKISIDKISNDKDKIIINKKEKPKKHRYGEYKNVLLSDEEMEKLKTEFPLDWEERIEKVSEYCASHGKSYKDYLATIRNWARRDGKYTNARNDVNAGYEQAMRLLGGDNNG